MVNKGRMLALIFLVEGVATSLEDSLYYYGTYGCMSVTSCNVALNHMTTV